MNDTFRTKAVRLLAGHAEPKDIVRYPAVGSTSDGGTSHVPRLGAVLEVKTGSRVRIWINGVTPRDGITMEVPPRMPGWMVRQGATFDARRIDSVDGHCRRKFSNCSRCPWQLLDLEGGTEETAGSLSPHDAWKPSVIVDVGQGDCTVAVDRDTKEALLIDCNEDHHLKAFSCAR